MNMIVKNNMEEVSPNPYIISKKEFISTMTLIKTQYDHDRKCIDAFAIVFKDNYISGYDNNSITIAALNLLSYVMKDTGEWIYYFIFELNFGFKYKEGDVSLKGKNIPLKTFDDLWNILINK